MRFSYQTFTLRLAGLLMAFQLVASTANAQSCICCTDACPSIIQNGDFEMFNPPNNSAAANLFATDYTYMSSNPPVFFNFPGETSIRNNAATANPIFVGVPGPSGGSYFLVVDGSVTSGQAPWRQTVPVMPNTKYCYSFMVRALEFNNLPILDFVVDGVSSGTPTTLTYSGNASDWVTICGTWTSGTNPTAIIEIQNINAMAQGNSFGLDNISFRQTLDVVISPENQTYCAGSDVDLFADPKCGQSPFTYQWTPATGLNSTTIQNPTATISGPMSYTVIVTDANGCTATASTNLTEVTGPTVSVSNDVTICEGTGTMLNASTGDPGDNYQWSPSAGLDNPNISNPTASPLVTTTYTVVVSDGNACTDEAQVTVTVEPAPTANAGSPVAVCSGSSTQLNASTGVLGDSYQWSPPTGLSATNIANPIASPSMTTTYTVVVTGANGCTASDNVRVFVPAGFAAAGDDVNVCPGGSVVLSASGGVSCQWNADPSLSNTSICNPTATPTATTTYTVVVTDANGCTESADVEVTVTANFADAGLDVTMCTGGSTVLNATGGTGFSWTPTTGLSNPNIANPTASPSTTTTYTVVVTDGTCTDSDQVTITVEDCECCTSICGANLIQNPGFDLDHATVPQLFTTDYVYRSSVFSSSGEVAVVNDAFLCNSGGAFTGIDPSGVGNILVVDGHTIPGNAFWKQTISVIPNTIYCISFQALNVVNNPNDPLIDFRVNGTQLPLTCPVCTGATASPVWGGGANWVDVCTYWFSGSSTTADLSMFDNNTAFAGNDFAIDNIQFAARCSGKSDMTEFPGAGELIPLDDGFELKPNMPNPFTGSTDIQFTLPEAGAVKLRVTSLHGQQVAVIVNDTRAAGTHKVTWDAAGVAPGIYFYSIEVQGATRDYSVVRKMIISK